MSEICNALHNLELCHVYVTIFKVKGHITDEMVAAGTHHSAAVTRRGELYAWGAGDGPR